jgi:hypothetical protein
MKTDQLALTPGMVSRLATFLITLAVGIGLSQLIPLRFWEMQNSNADVRVEKMKRRCRK